VVYDSDESIEVAETINIVDKAVSKLRFIKTKTLEKSEHHKSAAHKDIVYKEFRYPDRNMNKSA